MSSLSEKKNKILNFKGAVTATCTPYDKNGAINPSMISSYASHLLKIGVTGVYVHGSTGEGLSLTKDEKLVLTKKWLEVLGGGNTLTIMNVSATCYLESIELAKNFEQIGVDAIAILPPIYYRPKNAADLVKYLKLIADAAPNTPLVYYHIPILTYVNCNKN
ncbi:dihydrodipicolinate synthase-like protein [Leptotrombidium deliense]|uniref:N-acetylneuraminate lyase n=1 Tax=Leptotrombidium deliense TaxID=299467 RepID=A0A443RSV6_9ACAR|nr:dihydrodipicolinate synthase-like protein [Leptotrombidium deliense]